MFSSGNPFDVYNLSLICLWLFSFLVWQDLSIVRTCRIPNFIFSCVIYHIKILSHAFSLPPLYVKQFRLAGGNRNIKELLLSVAYSAYELKFSKPLFWYVSWVMNSLKEGWVDVQEKGFSSLHANFESCMLFLRKISCRSQYSISFLKKEGDAHLNMQNIAWTWEF